MEDKLRQEMIDGLDRMGEMIEDLRSTAKREETQPEPQAGDVWRMPGVNLLMFVHENGRGGLNYTFRDGGMCEDAAERLAEGDYTRIFSLAEHLKNKEAESV